MEMAGWWSLAGEISLGIWVLATSEGLLTSLPRVKFNNFQYRQTWSHVVLETDGTWCGMSAMGNWPHGMPEQSLFHQSPVSHHPNFHLVNCLH